MLKGGNEIKIVCKNKKIGMYSYKESDEIQLENIKAKLIRNDSKYVLEYITRLQSSRREYINRCEIQHERLVDMSKDIKQANIIIENLRRKQEETK